MMAKNSYVPSDILHDVIEEIIGICHVASQKQLLDGWSGNASARLSAENDARVVITAAGTPKGSLKTEDFIVLDMAGEVLKGNKKPSSESGLHLSIYHACAGGGFILHTHPPCLQAVGLVLARHYAGLSLRDSFLNIDLFEAAMWREKLVFVPDLAPGSTGLANEVKTQLENALEDGLELPCGVWLKNHGLCAIAKDAQAALCFTEELEHIAKVQLAYLCAVKPG